MSEIISDTLSVAAIQMLSTEFLDDNLLQAEQLISVAVDKGAQLVLLPENCFLFSATKFLDLARDELRFRKIMEFLSYCSKHNGVFIVAGSIPTISDVKDKVFSTSMVFSPLGEKIAEYHKIHLFDVEVNDNIGSYLESEHITPGTELEYFECFGHKIGLSICYDLRFPELYRSLVQLGCEVLLVPAAFTAATGEKHWETLLKARAIENQSFIIAANQGGEHRSSAGRVRYTWGHSMIIDADGKVLDMLETGEGVCFATLEFAALKKIRKSMPVLKHRKLN